MPGTVGQTIQGESLYSAGDSAWSAIAQADNGNDALLIKVTGGDVPMRWVATVRTVEVMWPKD